MPDRSGYTDGEPCWADVVVPDIATAKQFYAGVFGWTFTSSGPEFGNYTLCYSEGRKVAGVSPPSPGQESVPPAWSLYLATADADETARRITRFGGDILVPPMDIPNNGRMLFAFDPTGAAFGAWQSGEHTGADRYGEPGAICWAEVNTRDGGGADAFYQALFGYRQEQIGDGSTFDYSAYALPGGEPVCGRLRMTPEWDGITPHWMVYFAVEDTDAAADRVVTSGGKVLHGPFDSPQGRIAVVSDPAGANFSIIDPSTRVG